MATFAKSLETKLKTLEASQTGIQTLSLWIIHHKHHSGVIAAAWVERVKKVNRPEKQLGLFYLANDVVQNGRKKAKDLVTAFGKAFLEIVPLFVDAKTKSLVERVFNIWIERSVYEPDFVAKLRQKLGSGANPSKIEVTKTPPKPKQRGPSNNNTPNSRKVIVPPDFKVSNLLVSIKKTTSLDNEAQRKSKKFDNLKIDSTSYDSVKHVKDRSSVGKFHKQFDESNIVLEDYIHTLKRAEKDKRNLLNLLAGGEAFYTLAKDEAKVIVNAYNTFGNRLSSMKKKLDSKIKKMELEAKGGVTKEQTDSQGRKIRYNASSTSVQDMDLDSESDVEEIPLSQAYNPSTAPSHDELAAAAEADDVTDNNKEQQQHQSLFFDPVSMGGMSSFMDDVVAMGTTKTSVDLTHRATVPSLSTTSESRLEMDNNLFMSAGGGDFENGFIQHQQQTQVPKPDFVQIPKPSPIQQPNMMIATTFPNVVNTNLISSRHQSESDIPSDNNPAVQTLIDSLFPVLSRSLQTIKEKTQNSEEMPSVSAAMAFALGDIEDSEESARKKARFEEDPSKSISPVSLTNPKGLSDHQTELINIAAGLTEFDENFLPVENTLLRSLSNEEEKKTEDTGDSEKKRDRDDKKHRHRHKSHRRSASRSPQRRSSHRSSRDSRDDRRSDRRRSRRSPSPRRRSSKGSRSSRRSSSRERDEKRKHSPNSKPYYNNRRSPTPEMDSSQQQFQQQPPQSGAPSQMIPNPIVMPAQQFPQPLDNAGLPNQSKNQQKQDDPNIQPNFPNPGLVMNQTAFQNPNGPGEPQRDNPVVENTMDNVNEPKTPLTPGQPFPFNIPVENLVQSSIGGQMQIPPGPIIASQIGFPPSNIRPPLGMQPAPNMQILQPDDGLQIRPQQLMQINNQSLPPTIRPFLQMNQQLQEQTNDNVNNMPQHALEEPPQPQGLNFPGQFNPPFSVNNSVPPPFPGAPPVPPPFIRPGFRPPMNSDMFPPPPGRLEGSDGGKMFPPGGPEDIRPHFENMHENNFNNRPPFEQYMENQPRFHPRFHNSPGRPNFRPRGGLVPRHFRPRPPRPVL